MKHFQQTTELTTG